ncbi:unnamed protein product [Pleuronectes platessa]|uniref:Uncharacterized protein n=1 Tax=Pleuronectes platessa TaxID=8262 RepID=A0A9N7Z8K2_PLEPL|nr:unnamed protein product [Pleuronectes platessa]
MSFNPTTVKASARGGGGGDGGGGETPKRLSWSREESPEQHKEVDLAVSLPPHSHLVALRSGRRGDTPPVGRQDSLLKATGWVGGCSPDQGESSTQRLQLLRWRTLGVCSE